MVDLVSILYKVLLHMERSSRMTTIGILVLGIGAILVFGAIYYKTNKANFDAWIESWRHKTGTVAVSRTDSRVGTPFPKPGFTQKDSGALRRCF